ncbi:type II secretion system secretin GspD [Gallaecimonas xiamenensis]|uniref:General secretion pathway protein D n=1 Tax=Gallaecimonas xiamenensis 3-C-1 TaxID=745411 RepID=K2KJQ9_9GAMM|nr:type II secretion system secretin GspD [Gallaecimonas xiamenensis]EKE77555.1 general secretion pathway protein D [Gallaecimonas xiamenensis 3-C-1]
MAKNHGVKPTLAAALLTALLAGSPLLPALAAESGEPATYSAQFRDTDINEFISTVSAVLKKTIIVDPSVRGKIDVRSYDQMTADQYYGFFQNVLDVYGFAVVEMPNGVLKVVKAKDAKTGAIPVLEDKAGEAGGDEMITRVIQVHNVPVRELSPLLRQLVDNAGAGNVVHYDDSNVLIVTGRSGVVDRIDQIVRRVDKAGDQEVKVVKLKYASANQVVDILNDLNKGSGSANQNNNNPLAVKVVADERTNSVLVSGEAKARARIVRTIEELDTNQQNTGNTRVIYLQYAKAKDLVDVLQGVSDSIQAEDQQGQAQARSSTRNRQQVSIKAHEETNSLVLTGQPDLLSNLANVVAQLDIRRAQVHVEAMIVEIYDGDGTDLGVQWVSKDYGLQQFSNGNFPSLTQIGAAALAAQGEDGTTTTVVNRDGSTTTSSTPDTQGDYSLLAQVLGSVNGAMWGVIKDDWGAVIQAVSTNTKANILSTPSVTTLDNKEASFVAGEDVPLLTGSTASDSNSNPFQTIERQQLGVKLNVTPQINKGDTVQLEIKQEVSSRAGNTAVDITLNKREVNTTVLVEDGDTIVLGGLIDEDVQESESKVPLLGDIPIIGHLFSSTSTSKRKRNLMVFIHPTIVRDADTLRELSRRKYNLMHRQQEKRREDGISLMPFMDPPELPPWDDNLARPPSLEEYLEKQAREQKDD